MDWLIGVITIVVVCGSVALLLALLFSWMQHEDLGTREMGPTAGQAADQPQGQDVSAPPR